MIGKLLSERWQRPVAGIPRQGALLALLAFVVLTAGCSGFIGGDESVDDSAPLDSIPAEADGLVHVQTAIVSDSVTETVMNQEGQAGMPSNPSRGTKPSPSSRTRRTSAWRISTA
jgi:hypothetical protein